MVSQRDKPPTAEQICISQIANRIETCSATLLCTLGLTTSGLKADLDKAPVQIDVVAGMVGFDTSAYSVGYIAGWADGDTDLIKSTAARVLRTAHQIAGILTPEDDTCDAEDVA